MAFKFKKMVVFDNIILTPKQKKKRAQAFLGPECGLRSTPEGCFILLF